MDTKETKEEKSREHHITFIPYGDKYHLSVDKSLTLEELLNKGDYETIFYQVYDLDLSDGDDKTENEVDIELLTCKEDLDQKGTLKELERQNYRPATLRELLTFGIQHPEVQKDILIFSLGAITVEEGSYEVNDVKEEYKTYWCVCLYSWLGERVVYYAEFDGKYRDQAYFACVKNKDEAD